MARKIHSKPPLAQLKYPEDTEQDQPTYSNYILVNHTPWDFALHFGLVTSPTGPQKEGSTVQVPVKKLMTVQIPVPIIKGLIKALQTNVERYEKTHGEIKVKQEIKS